MFQSRLLYFTEKALLSNDEWTTFCHSMDVLTKTISELCNKDQQTTDKTTETDKEDGGKGTHHNQTEGPTESMDEKEGSGRWQIFRSCIGGMPSKPCRKSDRNHHPYAVKFPTAGQKFRVMCPLSPSSTMPVSFGVARTCTGPYKRMHVCLCECRQCIRVCFMRVDLRWCGRQQKQS